MSASFGKLFDDVSPALLRYVRRLTGSLGDAEEIVQETFLKLHQRMVEGGEDLTSASAWLFRVATNAARDLERERRVRAREEAVRPDDRVA
ncbi:MAG TPA: RNA polymerase sigma factor, partial [Thermoanaerobaculia bacterium]|nr:RNA polymerase sigma factor [Thermoanaerobaculia bacterium]